MACYWWREGRALYSTTACGVPGRVSAHSRERKNPTKDIFQNVIYRFGTRRVYTSQFTDAFSTRITSGIFSRPLIAHHVGGKKVPPPSLYHSRVVIGTCRPKSRDCTTVYCLMVLRFYSPHLPPRLLTKWTVTNSFWRRTAAIMRSIVIVRELF